MGTLPGKLNLLLSHARSLLSGMPNLIKLSTLIFLISSVIPLSMALQKAQEPVRFSEKALWIQLGNQIKEIDESMFRTILDCGFDKVILLNSAVSDRGYFPILESFIAKCRPHRIKVSMGDLVFKEAYLKNYWNQNPALRKRADDGSLSVHPYYHYQICPNNPVNQEYIARALVEKAVKSGVDEIHVDYECTACYCSYCLEDFMKQFGKDARFISTEDKEWRTWRSSQTSRFFKWLAMKIGESDPGMKISVTAPIIGMPDGFTEYGIDLRYEDLAEFVNEFVPMIYISECLSPRLAGRKHCSIQRRLEGEYVIPGLILAEERMNDVKTAGRIREEIKYVYRSGARGLVVFEARFINDDIKAILRNI